MNDASAQWHSDCFSFIQHFFTRAASLIQVYVSNEIHTYYNQSNDDKFRCIYLNDFAITRTKNNIICN